MFFEYGREEKLPTQYGPNRSPVTVDVLDIGFIFAALILAFSFYVSMITKNTLLNIYFYTRVTISIMLGVMIMLGNFGQEWEVGHINTPTLYKAGSHAHIQASIGIKIGLRSVNVTLKADTPQNSKEVINYNERFHWGWDQGRFGFGPYAGQIQQEFRQAQYRGVPLPILWVVDYFVIDGEGFRHGRFYRTAGWYAHIAMWSAFPMWLLAMIFFRSVIRYGGYCLGISGCLLLTANLVWLVVRNPHPLKIPFESGEITTKFGPSYWLTFSTGVICIALAIAIYIADSYFNTELHIFFDIDPLIATDVIYVDEEEYTKLQPLQRRHNNDEMELIVPPPSINRHSDHRQSMLRIVHVRKNTNDIIKESRFEEEPFYDNLKAPEADKPPLPPMRRRH